MRKMLSLVATLVVCACAGKDGPTGPSGAQGPQGPSGPGTRYSTTAIVGTDGRAAAALPSGIGTNPQQPPIMGCYLSDNPNSGIWIAVNDGYTTTSAYCAATLSAGIWTARMSQAPAGWTAAFVVVY